MFSAGVRQVPPVCANRPADVQNSIVSAGVERGVQATVARPAEARRRGRPAPLGCWAAGSSSSRCHARRAGTLR